MKKIVFTLLVILTTVLSSCSGDDSKQLKSDENGGKFIEQNIDAKLIDEITFNGWSYQIVEFEGNRFLRSYSGGITPLNGPCEPVVIHDTIYITKYVEVVPRETKE